MASHGDEVRGSGFAPQSSQYVARFGRMFRRLPTCPEVPPEQLQTLADSMRGTELTPPSWGPATPPEDRDNPGIPAGYTYFGQFVDHDITFDPVSSLERQNDPDALSNFRTPAFDLDSIYGSGPHDEPFQYELDEQRLLVVSNNKGVTDLPRNSNGTALIGDPRNDENVIVSQLQLVFLKLHNRFLAQVKAAGPLTSAEEQFREAQRLTRWHYQWVVVHDFLRRLIGDDLHAKLYEVDEETRIPEIRRRHYQPRTSAYMPIEFSAAAYRFGHSQVRDRYALNAAVERPLFLTGDDAGPLDDLRGKRPLEPDWDIDWSFFVEMGENPPQPSRLIDTRLSPSLFDLPGRGPDQVQSLALLNLLRGQRMSLPSGQAVAGAVGQPVLTSDELRGPEGAPVPEPTPLWYYLLRESQVRTEGRNLGPTCGRIIGEVLLGLLEQDPSSYYSAMRGWEPAADVRTADGTFGLAQLISFATIDLP